MTARHAALDILQRVFRDQAYINIAINKDYNLSSADKSLCFRLVHGVTQHKLLLDHNILAHSKLKPKKISLATMIIMELGAYQLFFMDRIPKSAAVNQSVELAKKYGHGSAFVNAILRKLSSQPRLTYPPDDLSIKHSFPKFLVDLYVEQWGYDETDLLLEHCNKIEPSTVRVNRIKQYDITSVYPDAVELNGVYQLNIPNIENEQDYKDGYFTLQGQAEYQAAVTLTPKEGERVLDMCAAPGGKTTQIAEIMGDCGQVVACDIHPARLKLIQQNALRLGLSSIETCLWDATIFNKQFAGEFDCCLVDAPCTGFGIVSKKPDIKWKRKPEDILTLAQISEKMLQNGAEYLKPGGRMVYSTCTLTNRENGDVVDHFLKTHNDFSLSYQKTFLPHRDKTDGFFICLLQKR